MKRLLTTCLLGAALLPLGAPAADAAPYRGRIEIRHADDFSRHRAHTDYRLVHRGRRTPLVLAKPPRIDSGTPVVVNGRRAGSRIRGTVRSRSGLLRAAAVSPGPRKTAVILIKFSAAQADPWTAESARSAVFTASDSANAFYAEDSYGDVSLIGSTRSDGDVYGWYTIAAPVGSCSDSDVDAWATQAKSAAAADGFVASNYKHVIYSFPQQSACAWSGLGEMPGKQTWINGPLTTRVLAHELGHNMGMNHASSLRCTSGGVVVAYSSTCTTSEYGDPFDVMGTSRRRNNAWHLQQTSFLKSANVQTATTSGTYTLTATTTRGTGPRLLRVPKGNGSPLYYDLELRGSGGVFDNFLSTDPAVNGVTIHVDPSPTTITQSLLIDATPGTSGGFNDAPLAPGRSFTDGTVVISVSTVSGDTATVSVATAPPDTAAPTAPVLTAQPTTDRVALSWTASTDNVGVSGYRVYRNGTLVRTTTRTSWTDFAVTAGGAYDYRVEAYDAAANATSSATVHAEVPAPAPPVAPPPAPDPVVTTPPPAPDPVFVAPVAPPVDRTRPSVRIISPTRPHLRRSPLVKASASDPTGVARIEVWVDGLRRRSVQGKRLSWRWPLRRVRAGKHLIIVRAFDSNGNFGQSMVRVRTGRR